MLRARARACVHGVRVAGVFGRDDDEEEGWATA
jgi:hypothetical protein